jgi:hypothetical protein
MLVVGISVACRSSENFRGSPPLPCQDYTFSGGFLESCLSLTGSQSYLRLLFSLCYSLHYFFFSIRKSIQAFKGPWLSIPEASSWSRLPVFIFVLEFRHTRGLYKVSPRVHASCFSSARVCTRVVLVTVACLTGCFLFKVGQSSPPLMRSIPLRCLSLGLNSQ